VKLAEDMRADTRETNRRIHENILRWNADPTKTYVVPDEKTPVPFLNFAPLQNALSSLEKETGSIAGLMERLPDSLSESKANHLNGLLMGS